MILKLILIYFFAFKILLRTQVYARNWKKVVCYQGSWSTYRQSLGKYDVTDIDPFLCTHLMYAFFGIEESGELRVIDSYLDLEDSGGRGNIKRFNDLKLQNPTLKTLAAVGGWNEGSKKFSIIAADAEKRARFVQSVVSFLQRHGFDGLDLDWEYPKQRHNLTDNNDRENFITLLRELKEGLDPFGFMLTAAVGSTAFTASISYNISQIVPYLDFINIMSYDLHGSWDPVVGINAPLYAGANDKTSRDKELNVDGIIKYWLSEGAPRDKLVLGVPFYGRSFTLEDVTQHTPGSPHIGRGIAGQYTKEPGVMSYNEICVKIQDRSWTVKWEPDQMVPYAYQLASKQWIGYETPRSIGLKAQYAIDNNLAGIMIWSIESDDFRGICGNEKYPLLKQINHVLFNDITATGLSNDNFNLSGHLEPKEFQCLPSDTGFKRDAQNCSKFYHCDSGITYKFACPAGLKFDLKTDNCNYAEFVKC